MKSCFYLLNVFFYSFLNYDFFIFLFDIIS